MIIEHFIKDSGRLAQLNNALSTLHSINFFGVLLEVGANRSKLPLTSSNPVEMAALNASWHNGYVEALKDMYEFNTRYLSQVVAEPIQDFGAREELRKAGDLRENE